MQNMFMVFFNPVKLIFWPTNIRRIGVQKCKYWEEKTKVHSFLLDSQSKLFSFLSDFRGNARRRHFSRSQMQIQLGIALKTRRLLEQNPWKAAKFSLSGAEKDLAYPPPSCCIVQRWAQKTLHKGICATSSDFATNPTAKASVKSQRPFACIDLLKQPAAALHISIRMFSLLNRQSYRVQMCTLLILTAEKVNISCFLPSPLKEVEKWGIVPLCLITELKWARESHSQDGVLLNCCTVAVATLRLVYIVLM